MKLNKSNVIKGSAMLGFAAAVFGVIVSTASADGPPFGGPCVRGIYCPAIYSPVLCPDGNIYSNACEAWVQACQLGCVPAGDI